MKNIKAPVTAGDILEFKVKNTTVRGEIFALTVMKNEIIASVYDLDIFTKNCKNCDRSKCEFLDESKERCTLSDFVPRETAEINMEEIGSKYKIVRKSWDARKKD